MSTTPAAPQDTASLNMERRAQAAGEWVRAAYWVAKQTNDKEAQDLLGFFANRWALLVPLENGQNLVRYSGPPQGNYEDYVYMAPLLPGDARRLAPGDPRQHVISGEVAGRYTENSQAIYVPTKRLARVTRGLVLLHELKHAELDIRSLIDRTQPNAHWKEEADVFLFEFRLLSKLGGVAYQQLLNDSVSRINKAPDKPNTIQWSWDDLRDDFDSCLAQLRARGRANRGVLAGVRMFHAYWQYATANYDDPHHELAMFLRDSYRRAGQGEAKPSSTDQAGGA